jgi:hypothetical protein
MSVSISSRIVASSIAAQMASNCSTVTIRRALVTTGGTLTPLPACNEMIWSLTAVLSTASSTALHFLDRRRRHAGGLQFGDPFADMPRPHIRQPHPGDRRQDIPVQHVSITGGPLGGAEPDNQAAHALPPADLRGAPKPPDNLALGLLR